MRFETEQEQDLDRYDDGAVKSYVSIGEVIAPPSPYMGSTANYEAVKNQLREKYGDKIADEYDPTQDCRTYKNWASINFRVRRGEKALKSITFVEAKDASGKGIRKYPKTVFLFHYKQVDKV